MTLHARFGPLRIVAPTRVVYVIDEPDRRGFAYGTLPGHPESGEEVFIVERQAGSTSVEVRAFSRPGRWFTRLGAPVARRIQRRRPGSTSTRSDGPWPRLIRLVGYGLVVGHANVAEVTRASVQQPLA